MNDIISSSHRLNAQISDTLIHSSHIVNAQNAITLKIES